MKRPSLGILLLVVFLTLPLGGCAVRPTTITAQPAVLSPELFVAKLRVRTDFWQNYQARLRISAESTKGKFRRIQTVVLAVPPDRFRLEAFSPVGQVVSALVSDAEESALWVPSEKVVYKADHAETLIESFIGVPVPLEVLIYSLTASIPPKQLDNLAVTRTDSTWLVRASEPGRNLQLTYEFLAQPEALKSILVREDSWEYRINYDPPVSIEPDQNPKRIEFSSSRWQMEIGIDRLEKGPEISPSAFKLPFPAGIRIVNLGNAKWKEQTP